MSVIIKFTQPLRVSHMDRDTLSLIGELFEGLKGFSLLNSWEDEDFNRHFPLSPWLGDDDAVLVLVKDGCTGQFRELVLMSREHAYAAGMFRPNICQIPITSEKGE